jgi:hypothetical protein
MVRSPAVRQVPSSLVYRRSRSSRRVPDARKVNIVFSISPEPKLDQSGRTFSSSDMPNMRKFLTEQDWISTIDSVVILSAARIYPHDIRPDSSLQLQGLPLSSNAPDCGPLGLKRRFGRCFNPGKAQVSGSQVWKHAELLLAFWASIGFKPVTS